MKLVFFVIALILVGTRIYFSWSGRDDRKGDRGNIEIRSDGFDERISWLGRIRLDDSETKILAISPGGYIKFSRNDTTFIAESNVKGVIGLQVFRPNDLSASQRAAVAEEAVQELVHYGFDGNARMDAIFKRGGYPELLDEAPKMKLDNLQAMYIGRVLQADSLSNDELFQLITLVKNTGDDNTRMQLLQKFNMRQLDSPAMREAYFDVIRHLSPDVQQQNALLSIIRRDSVSSDIMEAVLNTIKSIGNDATRTNLYEALIDKKQLQQSQWMELLAQIASLPDDFQKSRLLLLMVPAMPKTEECRAGLLHAAKSISSDVEYGKVMRMLNEP